MEGMHFFLPGQESKPILMSHFPLVFPHWLGGGSAAAGKNNQPNVIGRRRLKKCMMLSWFLGILEVCGLIEPWKGRFVIL